MVQKQDKWCVITIDVNKLKNSKLLDRVERKGVDLQQANVVGFLRTEDLPSKNNLEEKQVRIYTYAFDKDSLEEETTTWGELRTAGEVYFRHGMLRGYRDLLGKMN